MRTLRVFVLSLLWAFSSAVSKDGNLSDMLKSKSEVVGSGGPVTSCTVNYSCLNCTTVRVCGPGDSGIMEEKRRFTCPASTAWCYSQTGTCVAQQPAECLIPTIGQFDCMRDGIFPNLNDCASYFHCQSGIAYIFKCVSPNRYFHPGLEVCHTSSYCSSGNICSGKSGVKVIVTTYGNNKQLFAYCANSTVAAVDKCIGSYVFNVTSQLCEQSCPHAGLFPSASDCSHYYKCVRLSKYNDLGYNITQLTCPSGEGFLESQFGCVNRTRVPNCHVNSPSLMSRR